MSGVDNVIECAIEYAENRHHEYVTVEHLMLCLLETPEISEIVDALTDDRETDINDLIAKLDSYKKPTAPPVPKESTPSPVPLAPPVDMDCPVAIAIPMEPDDLSVPKKTKTPLTFAEAVPVNTANVLSKGTIVPLSVDDVLSKQPIVTQTWEDFMESITERKSGADSVGKRKEIEEAIKDTQSILVGILRDNDGCNNVELELINLMERATEKATQKRSLLARRSSRIDIINGLKEDLSKIQGNLNQNIGRNH